MPISAAADADKVAVYRPYGLVPKVEQILKVQGYGDPGKARPAVHAAAETAAGIASRVIAPEAWYRRIGVRCCAEGLLALDEGHALASPAFDRHLAGCDEVIAFVLTLGGAIDQVEGNMSATGRMLEAVLLQAAAWMALEQATKQFTAHLRALVAPEGLMLSRRLAPGYTVGSSDRRMEWPLTDQPRLFALFGDAPIPVQLLESCGMVPKMSRSGLFGLRPAGSEAKP